MADTPPSTNSMSPTMKSESSETRKSTARAMSIGTPLRPRRLTTGRVGSNSSLPTGEPILFGTTPLTRMLCGASCTAIARVRLAIPPLAAAYATARERPKKHEVDPAPSIGDVLDQLRDVRLGRDVRDECRRLAAVADDFAGDLVAAPRIHVDHRDAGAVGGKHLGDLLADVAARAGDDRDLVLE